MYSIIDTLTTQDFWIPVAAVFTPTVPGIVGAAEITGDAVDDIKAVPGKVAEAVSTTIRDIQKELSTLQDSAYDSLKSLNDSLGGLMTMAVVLAVIYAAYEGMKVYHQVKGK